MNTAVVGHRQGMQTGLGPVNHLSPAAMEVLMREQAVTGLFDPRTWEIHAAAIHRVEVAAFGPENAFSLEGLRDGMCAQTTKAVLLSHQPTGALIGYTYAFCQGDVPYVCNTALLPDYQGRKLILPLMEELEGVLRQAGYDRMWRHARVANGYADKIEAFYGARVIQRGAEISSRWGNLRPLVVSLKQ